MDKKDMNNLAKIRGKLGLSQTELAQKIGCTKANISFAEKNKLGVKMAKKCSNILDKNIIEILGLDVFKYIPQTEEEKELLINLIKGL